MPAQVERPYSPFQRGRRALNLAPADSRPLPPKHEAPVASGPPARTSPNGISVRGGRGATPPRRARSNVVRLGGKSHPVRKTNGFNIQRSSPRMGGFGVLRKEHRELASYLTLVAVPQGEAR